MRRKYLFIFLLLVFCAAAVSIDILWPAWGYRSAFTTVFRPGDLPPPPGLELLEDVRKRKQDFVVDYFGMVYRGNTANYIDASVYYYGAYEKPELFFLRETLAAIGSEAVVVDVGANTGLYSAFASKYAKEVHAIEPFPPVLARLRALIAENKIQNIVVHAVGLGDAEAELAFFSPPEGNLGTGSFVSGYSEKNRDEHLKLRIVSGDAYFPQAGIQRIDIIKMDIEGYEKAALAGLRETLNRHRPVVLLEVSVDAGLPQLFKSLEELKAAFPQGYAFLEMAQRDNFTGAYQLHPLQGSFTKEQFYVVAHPNEKGVLIPMILDGRSGMLP